MRSQSRMISRRSWSTMRTAQPSSSRTPLIVSSSESDSALVHARRRLVEQQEARAARERSRDLRPTLLTVRQRDRQPVAVRSEAEPLDQARRPARRPARGRRRRPRRSRRPSSRRTGGSAGTSARRRAGRTRAACGPSRRPRRPRSVPPSAAGRRSRGSGASSCRSRSGRSDPTISPPPTPSETPSSARSPRKCFAASSTASVLIGRTGSRGPVRRCARGFAELSRSGRSGPGDLAAASDSLHGRPRRARGAG